MIKTFFFDLGNVLLFFDHNLMCQQVAEVCQIDKTKIYDLLFNQNVGELYETGMVSTEEAFNRIIALSDKPVAHEQLFDAISNIFAPNEEIVPLLDCLKANGTKLILISNICEAHHRYIEEKYEIFPYFDHLLLSYQVKARKPDVRIYHEALVKADCLPEESFYLDDIPEYVKAASELGIPGHVFKNVQELKQIIPF